MNLMKKVGYILYRYITFGVDEHTSINDRKKITLLHIFSNTWLLFTLLSFIEDYYQNRLLWISYPIMLSFIISVQILLYYKKLLAASLILIGTFYMTCLLFSNLLYTKELLEYYFLLPPATALIYIDNRKWNIVILFISLLGLFLPNLFFKHYPYSVFNNMNSPFLFFSIFIIINYFKNLNIRNEQILEAKTKELEELDKFKSQFFTNISHEIRTPLTLINGQISELSAFTNSNPSLNGIQNGIQKQITSITNIVDDVLDLAKMQSSEFQFNQKSTNVSELLHKTFLNFEPLFQQKNITFNLKDNELDYFGSIDPLFFERAINNILVNVLKYTDQGKVSMSTYAQNNHLYIAISDTGIGVSKRNLKVILKRFYQVNNDINKSGGSGVGLAFSKEIIELHGGKILLESKPNKGSIFTITLPLEKCEPAVSRTFNTIVVIEKEYKFSEMDTDTLDYSFLIVDDNYDMRQYLTSILKRYTCYEADNGVKALEIIQQKTINFVITDYMMPKLNGYELLKKLKENNCTIPIIMLTAKTDVKTKLDVLKLGVNDYITKPFDKEELLTRIKNCIKNYNARAFYNQQHHIETSTDTDNFMEQLEQYVYKNSHDTKLNQEVIANKFNISKSSFYRKIKSNTGLTPNNFIKEIRLQKARAILEKNPTILLKQLALEVGFAHNTYFSKIYTERFGVKPFEKK